MRVVSKVCATHFGVAAVRHLRRHGLRRHPEEREIARLLCDIESADGKVRKERDVVEGGPRNYGDLVDALPLLRFLPELVLPPGAPGGASGSALR